MRTTRSQTNEAGDDSSGGTGTLANEATKKTSKAPLKHKSATSKATAAKKATGGKKGTDENQIVNNGNDNLENDSPSGLQPLPTPANSVGDLIPHRNSDDNVLALVRQGMQNKAPNAVPFGVANPGWMCYCNSVITMLLNITPFIGYVNRVHGSNVMAGLTDPDTGAYIENPERDLLSRLNDIAIAYWSDDPAGVSSKQARINQLVTDFWNYTMDLNASFDAMPWNPGQGKERYTFQDAADYLLTVLNLAIAQLSANPNIVELDFKVMIQSLMQRRSACAGTGRSCPDERRRLPANDGDAAGMFVVNVANGNSLEECIVSELREENELICDTCAKLPNLKGPGRLWWKLREAPEVLLVRLSRFTAGKHPGKSNKIIAIPERLDLTVHLEQEDRDAGTTAQYQLDSVVSHAGTLNTGHYVTHVRLSGSGRGWRCIDDANVSISSFEDAVGHRKKFQKWTFTPVILAYTKIHDSVPATMFPYGTTKNGSTGASSKGNVSNGNDSRGDGIEDDDFKRTAPKSSIANAALSSHTPQTGLATFTASLLPIGGTSRNKPFFTVTHGIKLDFNVGVRDAVPIQAVLTLSDGRQLSLKKLSGGEKQYVLSARRTEGIKANGPKKGSKSSPHRSAKPYARESELEGSKRKAAGSPSDEGKRPNKIPHNYEARFEALKECINARRNAL